MRILGFDLAIRRKAAQNLQPVDTRNTFWAIIRESFAGAWQQNVDVKAETGLRHPTLYRCVTLIATDVAKMPLRLVRQDEDGIWTETESASFSPVIRKPNHYQTRIQFITQWMISKLTTGNAYILKIRDEHDFVAKLFVLDPSLVTPLISDDGSVFYRLGADNLSEIEDDVPAIPASEIIHDRMNTLFHPLVGISPIFAAGLPALLGLEMMNQSTGFFQNGARPSGILTAPGAISDETAARLKAHWDLNYSGVNAGKTAVLGDGLEYKAISMSAADSQVIEQFKWTDEKICTAFGVPAYMAGVGTAPLNNNVEALTQQYYGQCLQIHIENLELCLDEGLELPKVLGTEFDLNGLLRMDTAGRVKAAVEGIGGGLFAPNEKRKEFDLKPAVGGDSPMMQQQQFSLAALAERDRDKPFAKPTAAPSAAPANDVGDETQAAITVALLKSALADARTRKLLH